jgi:hypothetical protein
MDARSAADRVDRLLDQLRAGPNPGAAAVAEDLVRCLVQLYGAGLERIVRHLGPQHCAELCADPLVESLLLIHDLHPLDPDTRIRQALAGFSGVRYHGIDGDGVARVRLANGRTCQSSARSAVEAAIRDAAPEVTGVVVEAAAAPSPLLQISLRPGLSAVR